MNKPAIARRAVRRLLASLCLLLACFLLSSANATAAVEPGTLQIVARYATGSPARHTYMAMGEAVVFVEGQDAKLEADQIFYDDRTLMLEARGHVRITRHGKLTKESSENLKFKVDEPEYLLTESVGQILGPKMVMLAPEDIAR
jgi:lipopolysaccharide assembly outer membrane protein LptD (OstA)